MRIEPIPSRPGLQLRDDQGVRPIHPLWLRERCDGAAEMDPVNHQRLYDPSDLDPAVAVTDVNERAPGLWQVRFSDGVGGTFAAADLLDELPDAAAGIGLPARRPWDATLAELPIIAWRAAPSAGALFGMVETFLCHGFVILRGVPTTPDAILEVARTFGFPRDTNFGLTFEVRSVPDAADLAYTGLALDPHTDNPYRDPVPGVQLLHCLANRSTGGLSTLVDGLAVATALRARDPAAFAVLATTPVRFVYRHGQTELVDSAPILELDSRGAFAGIRFSPKLDFVPLLAEAELTAFYRARKVLDRMLRSEEFEMRFLLADGDLMMMDNRRLLHGRTAFDPLEGLRHLQGCYIDADGPRSLYRVLRRTAALAAAAD
jgi:gamma-butyrobetaine dioxygenase